jgi:hypothetical protein
VIVKTNVFTIKRGTVWTVKFFIYRVTETQQDIPCYNNFAGCCPNDGHLLDSTLCGVLYLLKVLEECSAFIVRVTKLVLVAAEMMVGIKRVSYVGSSDGIWSSTASHLT